MSTHLAIRRSRRWLITAATTAVLIAALDPSLALAQSTDVFGTLQSKGVTTFQNVRNICYVLGAFGLIAVAVMAFFGRFNWKHLAGLIGGLILIAAAASFIDYATTSGSGVTVNSAPALSDTLGN